MSVRKTSDLIWQDTQHQVLFELIDQIRDSRSDLTVFARLTSYAEEHFALEEAYMKKLDYPYAREHIQAHDKFRRELKEMVAQQSLFDKALRETLSLFLSEWLKRHVFGIDKKFERFVLMSDFK